MQHSRVANQRGELHLWWTVLMLFAVRPAPSDAYNAACFLSLCVPIAAKHDKLDATQRKNAAQFYGDAAMRLLRDSVSNGYKDSAHITKDSDLDPLRQREDFQKLVAELEEKRK